jgi:hypothetical protein
MKKIKITEEQARILKYLEEGDAPESPLKSNEFLRPTNQIKRNFKKETKGLGLKFESETINESITWELYQLAQEILNFVRDVYADPSTENISPFWQSLGMTAGEVKQLLTDVGLMGMATFKGISYFGKKDIIGKLRKLYKKIRQIIFKQKQEKAQNTFKSDMDEDNSNLPPPDYATVRDFEVKGISKDDEVAILGKDGKLYALYIEDKKDAIGEYAERTVMGTYKDEDGSPYDEYHEDFDIDEEAVENFVNDRQNEIGFGAGMDGWYDEKITLIDAEVMEDILDHWPDLASVLKGMAETTTAASSGSFVTKLNDQPHIKRDRFPSEELAETTDWAQVAGDSGTFAYDAPAGDGDDFWTAGNKMNKKMNKNGTVSEDAKKDTQWPDGAFVEMPACSKLDNNKEAQNGGCNQGAGAKIKYKTSKNSIISDANLYKEVAEKTGRSISEVVDLINNYKNK